MITYQSWRNTRLVNHRNGHSFERGDLFIRLSKGVVYHCDNKDKVKRHLNQHQKGKLVNKSAASAATAAHKLLRSNR
jgi:hypothetical protein